METLWTSAKCKYKPFSFVSFQDVTAAVIELALQDIPFITVRLISILGKALVILTAFVNDYSTSLTVEAGLRHSFFLSLLQ